MRNLVEVVVVSTESNQSFTLRVTMEPTGFVSSTAKNLTQFSAQLEIFYENVLEVEVDR